MDPILKELRQSFDGSDNYLRGHQIITLRKGYRKSVPEWAADDAVFRDMLLLAFPKTLTDERQRARAARWTRVRYLFYQGNYTRQDIATEMNTTVAVVKKVLVMMRRVGKGLQANGKPRGLRPRGNFNGKSRRKPAN